MKNVLVQEIQLCKDLIEGSHLESFYSFLLTSVKRLMFQLLFLSYFGPEKLFIFITSAIKPTAPVL